MITVDMILQLKPCWSTPFIERALKKANCTSWVGLFTSARDDDWKTCSSKEMSWLLRSYAALNYPETFMAWVSLPGSFGAWVSPVDPDALDLLLDLAHRLDEARRGHD